MAYLPGSSGGSLGSYGGGSLGAVRYEKLQCPRCYAPTYMVRHAGQDRYGQCQNCGYREPTSPPPTYGYQYAYISPAFISVNNPPAPKDLPEESIVCATGGITGWRKWNIGLFSNKIQSIRGTVWEPYTKLEAKCSREICAGATCDCGIYSWKEASKLNPVPAICDPAGVETFDKLHQVKGSCWLWGRVLECQLGYRAQYCYPKEIFDTGHLARQMAIAYGVKLIPEPERPKVEPKKEEPLTATGLAMQQNDTNYLKKVLGY